MAYKDGSEVYFAKKKVRKNAKTAWVKIGETANSVRRGRQLHREDFEIVIALDVPMNDKNGHNQKLRRMAVENYLREKILREFSPKRRKGNDYFSLPVEEAIRFEANFEVYVQECLILKNYI